MRALKEEIGMAHVGAGQQERAQRLFESRILTSTRAVGGGGGSVVRSGLPFSHHLSLTASELFASKSEGVREIYHLRSYDAAFFAGNVLLGRGGSWGGGARAS